MGGAVWRAGVHPGARRQAANLTQAHARALTSPPVCHQGPTALPLHPKPKTVVEHFQQAAASGSKRLRVQPDRLKARDFDPTPSAVQVRAEMLHGKEPERRQPACQSQSTGSPAGALHAPEPEKRPAAEDGAARAKGGTLLGMWNFDRPPNPARKPGLVEPAPTKKPAAARTADEPAAARGRAPARVSKKALAGAQARDATVEAQRSRDRHRGADAEEQHNVLFAARPAGKQLGAAQQADANTRLAGAIESLLWSAGSATEAMNVLHGVLTRGPQRELMLDPDWAQLGNAVRAEHATDGLARGHILANLRDFFSTLKGRGKGGRATKANEAAVDAAAAAVAVGSGDNASSKGLKSAMARVLGVSADQLARGAKLRANITPATATAAPQYNPYVAPPHPLALCHPALFSLSFSLVPMRVWV